MIDTIHDIYIYMHITLIKFVPNHISLIAATCVFILTVELNGSSLLKKNGMNFYESIKL